MLRLFCNILVMCILKFSLSDAISTTFSVRQLGQTIAQCFGGNEVITCFENNILEALDQAIANNETWKMNDFFIIEKNTKKQDAHANNTNSHMDEENIVKDKLAFKILQLAQTRSLKIQLPVTSVNKLFNKRSISPALDDFDANVSEEDAAGIGQDLEQEEGRGKKHKEKNMAMMGGMAMLAMVAQMFLGKVILIAGTAFIMAKIALLISTLGSLKKGTLGGSPAGAGHVIVTDGAGISSTHSHEHISGWHRRTPFQRNLLYETISPIEQKLTEPHKYFKADDNNYLKNHHPYKKPPNKNVFNKINPQ